MMLAFLILQYVACAVLIAGMAYADFQREPGGDRYRATDTTFVIVLGLSLGLMSMAGVLFAWGLSGCMKHGWVFPGTRRRA